MESFRYILGVVWSRTGSWGLPLYDDFEYSLNVIVQISFNAGVFFRLGLIFFVTVDW